MSNIIFSKQPDFYFQSKTCKTLSSIETREEWGRLDVWVTKTKEAYYLQLSQLPVFTIIVIKNWTTIIYSKIFLIPVYHNLVITVILFVLYLVLLTFVLMKLLEVCVLAAILNTPHLRAWNVPHACCGLVLDFEIKQLVLPFADSQS